MRQPGNDASSPGDSPIEPTVATEMPSHQSATARASVVMNPATALGVARSEIAKGDVLGCARIAGIQACKRAAELIPSALPTRVGGVVIDFTVREDRIDIEARVDAIERIGVSMEAITACAVAALTIYDMCKASDRSMMIGSLALVETTTGDGATWRRDGVDEASTNL